MEFRGNKSSQGSSQKEVLLPPPSLNNAKASTCNQALEKLIQGLRRLKPNFPDVCQLKQPFPWMLWTTWHQRGSFIDISPPSFGQKQPIPTFQVTKTETTIHLIFWNRIPFSQMINLTPFMPFPKEGFCYTLHDRNHLSCH